MKTKLKALLSIVLCLTLLATTLCIGITSASAAANPYTEAAQALDAQYAYDGELGCFYTPGSTTFKLWSPTATSVALNLYTTGSDDEEGAASLGSYALTMDEQTGVWSVTIEGDLKNVYYTYSVTSPNSLVNGVETTRETTDPYSKAVGVNGDRSMVVDLDSTDPQGWEDDQRVLVVEQADAVIWEIQVKDFSYNENSGVSEANRGKFLAFTETGTTLDGEGNVATCIDYLKQLGVNYVQINPFYDFATIDEAGSDDQFNWGYDPKNYGVPEGSFSTNPYDGNVRINECKQMVQALHDAGIGVIMDVVYNHTYSTDSPLNRAVPDYYYRKTATGAWSSGSGCGNDTASERAMFRKYMIDMCKYWVEEYHIDGYRFDLMGLHDVETMNLIRDELDKIDSRIIMYGEGWSMGTTSDPTTCSGTNTVMCTQTNAEHASERIGFFNDKIRDGIKGGVFDGLTAKGFIHGSSLSAGNVRYGVRANTLGSNGWHASQPSQCVTYASCHDNNTLYDKIVAPFYGENADFRVRYEECVAINKLSAATVLTSQGMSFILAGEEMARSKDGNENSYNAAATLNMIDWENIVEYGDLVSYYSGLIDIRKAFTPFTADTNDYQSAYTFNASMATSSNVIAYTVANNVEGEWAKIAVILNGGTADTSVTLKDTSCTEWVVIANNEQAGVKSLGEVTGSTFAVPASSAIIAVDKASFDTVDTGVNKSTVTVEHRLSRNNKLLSKQVISGTVGNKYATKADDALLFNYDLINVDGDDVGVFTEEDKFVTFYYDAFVIDSLKNGDLNGDGKVNVLEATMIQKHLAKMGSLTDEQLAKADYNYDGVVNILDATIVQKYAAGFNVSIGSVTTKFVTVDENGKEVEIAPAVTEEYRLGEEYTTTPKDIIPYTVDDTKIPENASGIVSGAMVVKYIYNYSGKEITVHVKHDGDLTWAPSLWAWEGKENPTNVFASWPGYKFTDADLVDGWYTTKFDVPGKVGYSVIISNNGSPQTQDYDGITASEIWVVINDAKVVDKGDWITIYDEMPQ